LVINIYGEVAVELRLRIARQEDLMVAYGWANDPLTREMNCKQGTIPLDTFKRFFAELLYDKNILFLIIEGLESNAWHPVGQVKLYENGIISLSIGSEYRGRRLAAPAIRATLEYAGDNFPIDTVTAHIRYDNIPSIKAFERAGFVYNGVTENHPCVEYIFKLKKRAA